VPAPRRSVRIATNDKTYCWGLWGNEVPTEAAGAPVLTAIAMGAMDNCGVTQSGAAHCWRERDRTLRHATERRWSSISAIAIASRAASGYAAPLVRTRLLAMSVSSTALPAPPSRWTRSPQWCERRDGAVLPGLEASCAVRDTAREVALFERS
jgi:hypothetical protein